MVGLMEIGAISPLSSQPDSPKKSNSQSHLDFSKVLLEKTNQGQLPQQVQKAGKAQQESISKQKFHIEDGSEMQDEDESSVELVKKIKKKLKNLLDLERRFLGF